MNGEMAIHRSTERISQPDFIVTHELSISRELGPRVQVQLTIRTELPSFRGRVRFVRFSSTVLACLPHSLGCSVEFALRDAPPLLRQGFCLRVGLANHWRRLLLRSLLIFRHVFFSTPRVFLPHFLVIPPVRSSLAPFQEAIRACSGLRRVRVVRRSCADRRELVRSDTGYRLFAIT